MYPLVAPQPPPVAVQAYQLVTDCEPRKVSRVVSSRAVFSSKLKGAARRSRNWRSQTTSDMVWPSQWVSRAQGPSWPPEGQVDRIQLIPWGCPETCCAKSASRTPVQPVRGVPTQGSP